MTFFEIKIYFIFIQVRLVLDWLNLPDLRDLELERIACEYDRVTPWTENDEYEKRTMPREFKKPPTPLPLPSTTNQVDFLSTQIAQLQKKEAVKSHQHTGQYSTPFTAKPPIFEDKLSPIDKIKSITRTNTQILLPITENSSFDDQPQVKRLKTEEFKQDTEEKEEVCLSTIDDIEEDDLIF
jgi:hypothetical protein